MNETLSKSLAGIIRHILTTAGGAFGLQGVLDDSSISLLSGALATIVGVAWSIWEKKRRNETTPAGIRPKLFAPIIAAVMISLSSGCSTWNNPDQRALLIEDARDVGTELVAILLIEEPDLRIEVERARDTLLAIEEQDVIDLNSIVDVVETLPISELQTSEGRIAILTSKIFLRRLNNKVVLGDIDNLKPVVTALREGIDEALAATE